MSDKNRIKFDRTDKERIEELEYDLKTMTQSRDFWEGHSVKLQNRMKAMSRELYQAGRNLKQAVTDGPNASPLDEEEEEIQMTPALDKQLRKVAGVMGRTVYIELSFYPDGGDDEPIGYQGPLPIYAHVRSRP